MSLEEIRWSPWLDDMDRIIESMSKGIDLLAEDSKNKEGIEIIKAELHSIKGLYDSVGFASSTQTIYELEENVHKSKEGISTSLIEMLAKALVKVEELANTIRTNNPKPEEIDDVDKAIGFEAILIKFGIEYNLEIEIGGDRSLRSARALGVYNSIKRHANIKSSIPPEEDLYLDAKFDNLSMIISTRDEIEVIKKRVLGFPNVSNVEIEQITKKSVKDSDGPDLVRDLTIRVPLSNIRGIENSLAVLSVHIEALKSEVSSNTGLEELNAIDNAIERIQNDLKRVRKVPLDSISTTFPSMVKRLAKQEQKQIEFLIQGRFITLDRSLANHLIDPITQIIRNAISHGIETPTIRREAKKEGMGRIKLEAFFDRNKIKINITDDGVGLVKENILNRARQMNLKIPKDISDNEIYDLIFSPGFSLAVGTKLSGRGLGLSSAKERLNQIGGSLTVSTKPNQGTTFSIEFSDPDALTRNLIFNVNDDTYAVPTSEVEEVLIVNQNELTIESDSSATYTYEGSILPVSIMRNMISSERKKNTLDISHEILLVCRGKQNLIGLLVDSLVDERLVNIKPLNPLLKDYELFNGSLAGREREVILVVNPAAIM